MNKKIDHGFHKNITVFNTDNHNCVLIIRSSY